MRNVFGPDLGAAGLTVTTGPAPTSPASPPPPPAAPAKQDVAVAFNGAKGTGPVNVEFGLPVYATDKFNHLLAISVVAIPQPAPAAPASENGPAASALPTDADGWLNYPGAYVSKVDVSGQLTGGTATVTCNLPNGNYIAKSILTFDA